VVAGIPIMLSSGFFSNRRNLLVVGLRMALLLASSVAFCPDAFSREEPEKGVGAGCELSVDVTDILGHDLPSRVELRPAGASSNNREAIAAKPLAFELPKGRLTIRAPEGRYDAFVFVYTLGVPVLVEIRDVALKPGEPAFLPVSLLEGSSSNRPLLEFDQDCDFVLDRVEIACGTDPADAASMPGKQTLPLNSRVLGEEDRWYVGELHAHSSHGTGKESVRQLVRRAERAGLDFLAITDRNTMAASADPDHTSDRVVLVPAMEWGDDKRGVALLYGPRTFPDYVDSIPQAQAIVDIVQAQHGFYAIAHPCFPTAPWQWGLGFVNGMEVWCREWNAVPPMALEQLSKELQERKEGKLIHSIAYAAATNGVSANGQSSIFYDAELVRGLMAAALAGSNSSGPKTPLGEPATFVYAREKSVRGILSGMRFGRTYVTASPKGPYLRFAADVLADDKVDVSLGGICPLNVPIRFQAGVKGAKGGELQILHNGYPLISKQIESDSFAVHIDHTPKHYSVYRLKIIRRSKTPGFGAVDVLAMTSPIYAKDIDIESKELDEYRKRHQRERRPPAPEIDLPDPSQGEIIPTWQF